MRVHNLNLVFHIGHAIWVELPGDAMDASLPTGTVISLGCKKRSYQNKSNWDSMVSTVTKLCRPIGQAAINMVHTSVVSQRFSEERKLI